MGYRRGAHTVFELHVHLVWVTKYRKKVMTGEVALRVRDLIRQVCLVLEVEIMKGHVSKDHVHLFVSVPPDVPVSRLVQRIKGKSSYKLLGEFAHIRKLYWGRHFWARGYFACSSGNVTDEMVSTYIENQAHDDDTNFKVEGEEEPPGGPTTPSASARLERVSSQPALAGKPTSSGKKKPPP
jgi:putative transposase